jgi:hypothetical protein
MFPSIKIDHRDREGKWKIYQGWACILYYTYL